MPFSAEPPGGRFVYSTGPRGPRGLQGEQGEQGPEGPPIDPDHTHEIADVTGLQDDLDAKADLVGGVIPSAQIPALALTDVSVVASQVAQLALTAQEGDVAVRTDQNKTYIHNGGTAGTMADWTELLTPPGTVLSVNGDTGAVVLAAADVGAIATDYVDAKGDLISATADNTPAKVSVGLDRKVLTAEAAASPGLSWQYPTVAVSTVTANHSLVLTDSASVVRVNSASNLTVTVPANASVAFPVGSVVNVRRVGTGTVTIAAAGGVTVNSADSYFSIGKRYEEASLHKVATDTWDLVGALVA